MKKKTNTSQSDDILPEYDLKGKKSVRGKYAKAMQKGYSVRSLINLLPEKKARGVTEQRGRYGNRK